MIKINSVNHHSLKLIICIMEKVSNEAKDKTSDTQNSDQVTLLIEVNEDGSPSDT